MLTAEQFIVQSRDREAWLGARSLGVTSTTVAKAATPSGFKNVLEGKHEFILDDAYAAYGREREPVMMDWAHRTLGLLPNDWLIRNCCNPVHMATPDAASLDWLALGEGKTTGDPWDSAWFDKNPKGIPIQYRRQAQWESYVAGAMGCWIVWELRVPDDNGWFYCPWLEPRSLWLKADPEMQADLILVANNLMKEGYGF